MNLNLAGNQISSIDDSSVFEQMKNLVYLDLSYNNISHLEDRVFDKLMGLEKLFLQVNLGSLVLYIFLASLHI